MAKTKAKSSRGRKRRLCSLNFLLFLLNAAIFGTALFIIHKKSTMNAEEKIVEDFLQNMFVVRISQKTLSLAIGGLAALAVLMTLASIVLRKMPSSLWCFGAVLSPLAILAVSSLVYYVYKYEFAANALQEQVIEMFNSRKTNKQLGTRWSAMERGLACCGVFGPADYMSKSVSVQNKTTVEKFFSAMKKGAKIVNAGATLNVAQLYDELKVVGKIPASCYSANTISTDSNGCLQFLKTKIIRHNNVWLKYFLVIVGLASSSVFLSLFTLN